MRCRTGISFNSASIFRAFYPLGAFGSHDHLTVGDEEAYERCFEYEDDDEYDEKSDAYGIVNPTRPRSRPRIQNRFESTFD